MKGKLIPTTRDELVTQFEKRIATCERLLDRIRNGEDDDAWLVRNPRGNLCMKYMMVGNVATEPRAYPPDMATRFFDKALCERIAANTFNGAGEPAEVVLQSIALADDIKETQDLIQTIKEGKL